MSTRKPTFRHTQLCYEIEGVLKLAEWYEEKYGKITELCDQKNMDFILNELKLSLMGLRNMDARELEIRNKTLEATRSTNFFLLKEIKSRSKVE